MISNKKLMKIVDIIYWTIILITVIIQLSHSICTGEIELGSLKEFQNASFSEYIMLFLGFIFVMIFQFVVAIVRVFYISIIYFGIKAGYKKYNKEKLEKIDYKNDTYFRDIIPELSPAVLSYIDDFQLEEKDIVATLLGLQMKKKIEISNRIEIKDSNEEGLTENEKYVFQNLKDKTTKNINMTVFEQKVISDCKQKELLEEKENVKKEVIKKIIFGVIIYAIIVTAFNNLIDISNKYIPDNSLIVTPVFLILFLVMAIYPYKTVIYIKTYYFMNKLNPYIRNKKAKEINSKLEGLKKYIKDYSMIEERSKEELNVWEDYLIYSVVLGENTQIVKDIMGIIENTDGKA